MFCSGIRCGATFRPHSASIAGRGCAQRIQQHAPVGGPADERQALARFAQFWQALPEGGGAPGDTPPFYRTNSSPRRRSAAFRTGPVLTRFLREVVLRTREFATGSITQASRSPAAETSPFCCAFLALR